ncbi:cupin-like domain-containing protein [Danxiaibacter flavus]|uniref:Cupin-like domain-containing protein n=1 Tax=Danxiaibacter flavus TaxID=3049108 RepID=A0ABV3ZIY1_9BACT|nr:cupin-like domain-containing protein [Chitinophagaceae bacterium DXS]
MKLKEIEHLSGPGQQETFSKSFYTHKRPVILNDFLADKTVLSKWTFDFLADQAGDQLVDIYGKEDTHNEWVTSPPVARITFREYLSLIQTAPTPLRLFLFNLLKKKPQLKKDLKINDVTGGKILTWLPYLFFGGEESSVRYHYDIDMSDVFLTQLHGVKRIMLFSQDQSKLLYKLPFNFHGPVNLADPDYQQFPALRNLQGWTCDLHPGETLFIPSGFWHYIQYTTAGYSVSYRALSPSFWQRLRGLKNIFIVRKFDNIMRNICGRKWFDYKVRKAKKLARLYEVKRD